MILAWSHLIYITIYSSSRPKVFFKKGVLDNFAKFTGNTCARISFLINLQGSGLIKGLSLKQIKQTSWEDENPTLTSLTTLSQCRSSTKIVVDAKVSKKCRPPWLADGKNFRLWKAENGSSGFENFVFFRSIFKYV